MEMLFLVLCGLLVGAVLLVAGALRREAALLLVTFGLLDLLIDGILAGTGFFEDFSGIPPRLALVIVPNILLLVFFAFRKGVGERLAQIPIYWLVGFQSFRIVMEFILYQLVHQGRLPEILTFTGSNFDILVGITAPFVAFALLRPDAVKIKLAIAWNALGFLILTNTVVHGIGAVPTALQIFKTDPPNTLVAEFPWIWLPAFVVPCALLGHILSIRQLRASVHSLP